ncbi:hypothetical protein QUF80_14135 [Desulfococcaceae bacterium HSG8]|nr:hypothetical protein [Desulfococcaceae bacterium HSG8]
MSVAMNPGFHALRITKKVCHTPPRSRFSRILTGRRDNFHSIFLASLRRSPDKIIHFFRRNPSEFTFHVSRFTHYALRITHYVSRFTFHVSRFTHHQKSMPHPAPFTFLKDSDGEEG